jgi:hypothetical protein
MKKGEKERTLMAGPKAVPVPVVVAPPSPVQPRTSGIVELPSHGKLYGDKCPDGIVELYPMTGREETLVAGMTAANITEVFDLILKRCIKPNAVPENTLAPEEMLSSDKFYLMLVLRSNSYGSHYEFNVKCPECGARVEHACEIPDDFELKKAPENFMEPFTVELPRSGATVEFRLLRGKDDLDIIRYARREANKSRGLESGDPTFIYRLAKHIVTINGKTHDFGTVLHFVEDLIGEDTSMLRDAIDEATPGIITVIDLECTAPRCGNLFRADMPFAAGFFRSNKRRTGGAA